MYLSIESVLTYCTLVSILTACICLMLNHRKVICRIGPKWASVIALFLVVRMFFPFEFDFTRTIEVPWIFPSIWRFLHYEIISGASTVYLWMILTGIWVAGIIFHFGNRVSIYRRMKQLVRLAPKKELQTFLKENGLDEVCSVRKKTIQVVVLCGLSSPCIIGFKHVYILLPEKVYEKKELSLIMQHEMMHDQRKDILWKSLIDFLCSVFWWNPAFKYLKKTVFRMVEIADDFAITSAMSEEEKTDYMECLLKIAVDRKGQEIPFAVSFGNDTMKELKQRLQVMDEGIRQKRWLGRGLVLGVTGCLFLISFIIFIPYNPPPVEGEYEEVPFDYDSAFIIRNGDSYDVYEKGEYQFTTDEEIAKSFTGVKIYDSMEEKLEDE